MAIESELGMPKITKDGVTVAKNVYFVIINYSSSKGLKKLEPV